jgi:hypothetical protein
VWEVKRYVSGGAGASENGFITLLDAAKAVASSTTMLPLQGSSPVLWIKEPDAAATADPVKVITGLGTITRDGAANNKFTFPISTIYTDGNVRLDTAGFVNLALNYTPFGFTDADKWKNGTAKMLKYFADYPKWIIRNGVNDKFQDKNTDFFFAEATLLESSGKNWNGAVPFTVAMPKTTPPDGWSNSDDDPTDDNHDPEYNSDPDWKDPNFPNYTPLTMFLTDGDWTTSGTNSQIKFTVKSDAGTADWYYKITESVDENEPDAPPFSEFIKGSGTVTSGTPGTVVETEQTKGITVSNYDSSKKYQVWVVLVKDYNTTRPLWISERFGSVTVTGPGMTW